MEVPPEQERTPNDSRYATNHAKGIKDKENGEDDEEMLDKEEEKTPKDPFHRVWEGRQVLVAIEGRIKYIDSEKMTKSEKR